MRENETFKHNVIYNTLNHDYQSVFEKQSPLVIESARRTLDEQSSSTEEVIIIANNNQKYPLWIGKKEAKPCSSLLAKKPGDSLKTKTTTYRIKAQHLAHILTDGMQTALVTNMMANPNKHAIEFLAWFNHSLIQLAANYELNPRTGEPEARGMQDISDELLQDIIKKAKANPSALITFADTSSKFTPAMPSLDLVMSIISSSSIPSLKLHSRFALYFNQTPVFISTNRAFFTNDKEREIAEKFQQNLLTSFGDKLRVAIGDTSTPYHLSYVYWILRTSLDEEYPYDTPLDTKTLNSALKTGSLAQNGSLDPMAFFIDVMFLDEPDFIEKYRGSVKIDQQKPSLSAPLEQATAADHHASPEQTKKVKVKCPQELKGKTSPAVVTYLKSIANPGKQATLAQK